MTLDARASYPSERCYVLKIHRDARPDQGDLKGRLEHIASGTRVEFTNGVELLAWLARHTVVVSSR